MSFTPRALADGEISSTLATIFTATADIATYVKSISLNNQNVTNQTITFFVNRTGSNRRWKRVELEQDETADVMDDGESLLLEAGDSILAATTTSGSVDYLIDGVEENA